MHITKQHLKTTAATNFYQRPAKTIISGFLSIIFLGTILLMLPYATTHQTLNWVDAVFMATSATCVTGLSVIDIGTQFTFFGQIVTLLLIQIGGIGIMTLSTLVILMLGKRPGVINTLIMKDTFSQRDEKSPGTLLKEVLIITLSIESIGILLLFLQFIHRFSFKDALFYSIFHAISAFCNAGFSLFSNNLMNFKNDIPCNIIFAGLIILGGIGYFVISELFKMLQKNNKRKAYHMSLHSKLVLLSTGILILLGTVVVSLMEWNNSLLGMLPPHKIIAAFFQSVTARTAGFNTLPMGAMANETLFFLMFLMFIGGGPGSCAGGIKVTTFSALAVLGFSKLFGKQRSQIFNRSLSQTTTEKAISMLIVSITVIGLGTMFMLTSQLGATPHDQSKGKFFELLFETTSAFGTVGLSTGITPSLNDLGKLILTLIMFIGRIGPLTIVLAICRPTDENYYYPEENIMIG